MATTSILPLTLGQAVLGRATEPDAPPPEYLRIDGECWKLVTDPAAIEAAQAALEARERADSAFAMAQYAPRIANRPPALGDAEGKAPGAGWLEYDPATQLLKQMWRWTGQAWEELPMDPVMIPVIQIGTGTAGDLTADRLIVTSEFVARVAQILELSVENLVVTEGATINELVALSIAGATAEFQQAYIQNLRSNGAVIDEAVIGELASNLITSGLFRTADSGQRLEIDSNGLVMYGVDPDGIEYEMVRLGPSGDQLLTIGSSTISEGAMSAPRGEFTDLTIGGEDLGAMLAPLPRGLLGRMAMYENSDYSNSTNQSRLRLNVDVDAGRSVMVTVPPFYMQTQAAAAVTWILTASATRLDTGASLGATVQLDSGRHSNPDSNLHTVAGSVAQLPEYAVPARVAITLATSMSGSGTGVRTVSGSATPLMITAEDVGPARANTGTRWTYGNLGDGSGGSSGGGTGGTTPVAQRYVNQQWGAAGFGGDISAGDVVQGYYSGVGMRYGGWTFPASMKTALAGSTIEKFEVYLKNTHWYFGAGGTASIRPNDGSYKGTVFGGTQHLVSGWPRYRDRWVTLPSSWYPQIAAGTYGGISLQTASTSGTYYGRFEGTAFRTRVTYRK